MLAVAATVLVAWLLGAFRPSAPISSAVDASPTATLAGLASASGIGWRRRRPPRHPRAPAGRRPRRRRNPRPGRAAPDPVLIGTGDIARCDTNGDEQTARLVADNEGIVFTLGDNAYDSGSPAEFRDCYDPTWGRVKDRTELPVVGNHDYGTPNAARLPRLLRQARRPPNGDDLVLARHRRLARRRPGRELHRDRGGCGPGSPQLQWLRQDLRQSDARCTLAMWHQPRFSSGEHGNDPTVAPFWNVLYDAGADLILNGHDHDYERFAPQDPNGNRDKDRGIVEIVVGTGGGEMRDIGPPVANSIVGQGAAAGRDPGDAPPGRLVVAVPVDRRVVHRLGRRPLPLSAGIGEAALSARWDAPPACDARR